MKEILSGKFFHNLIFWALLIVLFFIVYFSVNDKENAVKKSQPVFGGDVAAESSDKIKIRQYLNILQRYKNKIEKSLEKRASWTLFTIADCDEVQETAFACENLFFKMGKGAYSSIELARIKAASNVARQLALDCAKLKSFIWAKKKYRRKIYSQLLKVESDILKIDIHFNALLKN